MQIEITKLCKSFNSQEEILKDLNLSIRKGEIVSILGPSGCGKSTILRILAGLESADSGKAELSSSMSFVFQQPLLLEWKNALGNVMLPLELKRQNDAEALAGKCLDLVGLGDSMGKFPDELSGGMKMRVSLARALVTDPQILLLDEPFAALDEMTRERLNEELLDLNRKKQMTLLFVSHNIFEAVFISDRIIILGNKPASIKEEILVDLPRPRKIEDRASAKFAELVGKVQGSLRSEN